MDSIVNFFDVKPIKQTHNSEIFLRPRFEVDLPLSKEKLLIALQEKLHLNKAEFPHKLVDDHIFIDIPKKDNHFWSPQLHLEVLETDQGSKLKGLFGPKPQVWTLFMFVHFVVGTSFLGCCAWAYTNYSLDKKIIVPLIFLIALPLVWIILYLIGRLGRDTGKKQTKKLQGFTLDALNSI